MPSKSKDELAEELKNKITAPAKEKMKLNESAYADHYTLIDSRWLLTTLKRGYQIGDDLNIGGSLNRIVAIESIPQTELHLVLLKSPVTHLQPVKRSRTRLRSGEKVYYLDEKSLWTGIKIHQSDIQSPEALNFHPLKDMTGFIGSGILVQVHDEYELAGVITNASTVLGRPGLSDTYQLTETVNTVIDNTIIKYALQ